MFVNFGDLVNSNVRDANPSQISLSTSSCIASYGCHGHAQPMQRHGISSGPTVLRENNSGGSSNRSLSDSDVFFSFDQEVCCASSEAISERLMFFFLTAG